ncbi:MAG: potassium channel family protein [Chloroflexota bacterium]|nr:potassium channel family protein [Chloroflexota bacterium]
MIFVVFTAVQLLLVVPVALGVGAGSDPGLSAAIAGVAYTLGVLRLLAGFARPSETGENGRTSFVTGELRRALWVTRDAALWSVIATLLIAMVVAISEGKQDSLIEARTWAFAIMLFVGLLVETITGWLTTVVSALVGEIRSWPHERHKQHQRARRLLRADLRARRRFRWVLQSAVARLVGRVPRQVWSAAFGALMGFWFMQFGPGTSWRYMGIGVTDAWSWLLGGGGGGVAVGLMGGLPLRVIDRRVALAMVLALVPGVALGWAPSLIGLLGAVVGLLAGGLARRAGEAVARVVGVIGSTYPQRLAAPVAMFTVGYLLLVVVFGGMFASVQFFDKDAFGEAGSQATFYDFQYFSLMTMTTLGYSDLKPVAALAKALVSVEAVLGMSWLLWGVVTVGWYVEEEIRRANGGVEKTAASDSLAQNEEGRLAGVEVSALRAEMAALRHEIIGLRAASEWRSQVIETAGKGIDAPHLSSVSVPDGTPVAEQAPSA